MNAKTEHLFKDLDGPKQENLTTLRNEGKRNMIFSESRLKYKGMFMWLR